MNLNKDIVSLIVPYLDQWVDRREFLTTCRLFLGAERFFRPKPSCRVRFEQIVTGIFRHLYLHITKDGYMREMIALKPTLTSEWPPHIAGYLMAGPSGNRLVLDKQGYGTFVAAAPFDSAFRRLIASEDLGDV